MPRTRSASSLTKETAFPLEKLRLEWELAWGSRPHVRLGRTMLEKSLAFKLAELSSGGLPAEQKQQLEIFIKTYKRNPSCFEDRNSVLKPGTRLVRTYEGEKHSVLVKDNGFEYAGDTYSSLSQIANDITGKRWNGWIFFGLKKAGKAADK